MVSANFMSQKTIGIRVIQQSLPLLFKVELEID